jgi:iron complex outermembrane receptor protein
LTYDISSDVKFKSISAYSSTRTALAQDFDNTPLPIFSGLLNDDINLFSQEVQLTRQLPSDRFRWTLGGYFYDSQEISTQAIQLGLGPVTFPNGKAKTDILSWAVYGQATYDLTTQLSATAGLRYSSENNSAGFVGTPSPAKATFTNTAPYLGLNYSVTPDAMLYVKASEGFRAGGVTQSLALPGDGVSFAPETAWTYEAGARLQFFDERLRINPTVFLTNWSNIQFNTLIPTATTVVAATQNAGDAQIKGFELESQFAATDQLLLTGSLGLLNGHYTRVGNLTYTTYPFGFVASLPNPVTGLVMPGSTVKLPNITLGQPLMRAPRTQFTVGAQYTLPLAGDSKIVASADYSWTDKQSSAVTIADSVELPAYGVLGARLQYDAPGGHWSAALFGTNLTDQFYLVGGVDFAKGFTTGTTELDVARPREVGVELRAHF